MQQGHAGMRAPQQEPPSVLPGSSGPGAGCGRGAGGAGPGPPPAPRGRRCGCPGGGGVGRGGPVSCVQALAIAHRSLPPSSRTVATLCPPLGRKRIPTPPPCPPAALGMPRHRASVQRRKQRPPLAQLRDQRHLGGRRVGAPERHQVLRPAKGRRGAALRRGRGSWARWCQACIQAVGARSLCRQGLAPSPHLQLRRMATSLKKRSRSAVLRRAARSTLTAAGSWPSLPR